MQGRILHHDQINLLNSQQNLYIFYCISQACMHSDRFSFHLIKCRLWKLILTNLYGSCMAQKSVPALNTCNNNVDYSNCHFSSLLNIMVIVCINSVVNNISYPRLSATKQPQTDLAQSITSNSFLSTRILILFSICIASKLQN